MKPIGLATAAVFATALVASCQPATEQEEPPFAERGVAVQVDARELAWCEIIARRATAEDCESAQKTHEKVETGTALIEWPRSIRRGERAVIRLEVGNTPRPTSTADDVTDAAALEVVPSATDQSATDTEESASSNASEPSRETEEAAGAVESTPYAPFVGRFMSAQLTGAGFEITPSGPVSRELPPNSQIDWEWVVIAKHDGLQTLVVTTYVEFEDAAGKRIPLGVTQKAQQFDVKVGVLGWIEDLLIGLPEWLKRVTAVLVALTGLVGAYFGLRRVLKNRGESKT